MNRRDFLRPGHLARTAGQLLAAVDEVGDAISEALIAVEDPISTEMAVIQASRQAMATTFQLLLPFGTKDALPAAQVALDEIDNLEAQLTVYRESSEVVHLNQTAFRESVRVEAGLFDLLRQCSRWSADSEGAFDVTTGALIKTWGFYRRQARVPSPEVIRDVLTRVGMKHVVFREEDSSIRFLRQGVELNLGSVGKGYALDRAAGLLRSEWKIAAGLLHGGQSSVYAIGTDPRDRRGWAVGLQHPWQPERRLAIVRLRDRGLGTSAATFQHLEYNGRKLGHLLDPRTGWPAEGIASASVLAPTAAEADALATAFFVLGVEKARAWCSRRPEIAAVLLPDGADALPITLNLAPDEVELVAS